MSWVTWRQHRMEGAGALLLTALLAAAIFFVTRELNAANCPAPAFSTGVGFCLPDDAAGQIAQLLTRLNLYAYALVVLPALAGAFIGCPLVAREVENGTHRLAWTQGVTRARWLLVKIVLVLVPLLVAAAVVGYLEILLLNQQGPSVDRWAFFDQQAPMTVASTLFALALGVALGAVIGRSVPAMAATLFGFVVVRIGLAELGRPNFIAPATYSTHDLSNYSYPPDGYSTAWFVEQPRFYDSAGHLLGNGGPRGFGVQPAYVLAHYQPGDRFWAFQGIESAILTVAAFVLVGLAIYWVTRRLS